jgi:hypothetical protein
MQKKTLWFILPVFAMFFFSACSSSWKVTQQANPNPFKKDARYFVNTASHGNLQVSGIPEAAYINQLDEMQQKKWRSDKAFFSKFFQQSVQKTAPNIPIIAGQPDPTTFVINPEITMIDVGNDQKPTHIKVIVRYQRRNMTIDAIEMELSIPIDKGVFSQRIQYAGTELGKRAAEYLLKRAK